jgi:branched-chain amino acid transport system permease protein
VRKRFRSLPSGVRALFWGAIFAIVLVWIGDRVDEFRVGQLANMAVYVVAIIGLVILTGYSGQVSLGHGALLGVGAYASTLTLVHLGWPIWLTFVAGVLGTAAIGAILGVAAARLSGPYLAGITLAFAVGLPSLPNIFTWLGGESGLFLYDFGLEVLPPERFGFEFSYNKWYFWINGLAMVLAVIVASNLRKSRYRRTWKALQNDEVAAALAGVHVARQKALAFTVAAGFAGLAGALYSIILTGVTPDTFRLGLSFLLITGAVLGGISYISGAFVGAAIMVFLPPILDSVTAATGVPESWGVYIPGLLTGLLLIVTIIAQPEGAIGQLLKHRHRKHA